MLYIFYGNQLCILFAAVDCGVPVDAGTHCYINSLVETTTYQTDIMYRCETGYWFSKSEFNKTSTCLSSATWSITSSPNCSRKYIYCSHLITSNHRSLEITAYLHNTFSSFCALRVSQ